MTSERAREKKSQENQLLYTEPTSVRSRHGTTDESVDIFGCSITDSDHEPCFEKVKKKKESFTCLPYLLKESNSLDFCTSIIDNILEKRNDSKP